MLGLRYLLLQYSNRSAPQAFSMALRNFKVHSSDKKFELGPYKRYKNPCNSVEFKYHEHELRKFNSPQKPVCDTQMCKIKTLDEKMYKPSKAYSREYQQTWKDCQPIKKLPVRCVINWPKIERRPRKKPCNKCSRTASCTLRKLKCPKVPVKSCESTRVNVKCLKATKPKRCYRLRPQYKSYSECKRCRERPMMPSECDCSKAAELCIAWRTFNERAKYMKHGLDGKSC